MIGKRTGMIFTLLFVVLFLIIIYSIRDKETEKADTTPKEDVAADVQETPLQSSKFDLERFTFQHELLISNVAAPKYIDEEQVVFSIDSSEKSTGYIMTVSRVTHKTQQLYQTNDRKIINSLVGIDHQLYWVEYPRELQDNMPWEIKILNLKTQEVQKFREGIGEDQILPPVLRVFDGKLTWIESHIENNVVTSAAMMYEPASDQTIEIADIKLDEQDKDNRDGAFFIIQRPIKDGIIIHQSRFKKSDREHIKSYELMFYPYDQSQSPKLILSDAEGVVDFTANDQWIVICKIGKVVVLDRSSGKIKYEIPGKDDQLTFDTPFFINGELIFRYSMTQILSLDLSSGKVEDVTEARSITSKIFNSDGYLGFSYQKAVDPLDEGKVEFNIIPGV